MSTKRFRIAFSFAGEKRDFVGKTAVILADKFTQDKILYDKYHESEFARHDLGIYLPKLYGKQSDLIVPVLCPKYDAKRWTGWEWMHIFGLLTKEDGHRVMPSRFEYAEADGLSPTAGFIELDHKTPEQFATLILERLGINEGHSKNYYTKPTEPAEKPSKPHVPHYLPRLDHFHGREKELAQIRDALRPEKRTWGALIAGPGGMGKTSLAVRAAEEHREQFDPVIFVSIKDRAFEDDGPVPIKVRFVSHYLGILDEIARALGRDAIPKSTPEDRTRLVLDALIETRALLILDNLESLTPEDRERIVEFVGDLPLSCKAVLTARRRIGKGINLIELDKLDEMAALATLSDIAEHNKLLARESEEERRTLWMETAGIPLLLRWTAGQLGRRSCRTIAHAIAFLRSCPEDNDPLEFIFGDLIKDFEEDEIKVLSSLTYFTLPVEVRHIAANAGLSDSAGDKALRSLANRSLVVDNAEATHYAIVPLVTDFIRKQKAALVAEAGSFLEKRAFEAIMENGYEKHDRFGALEAGWPGIAPALTLFLAGDNARLQTVCGALADFLHFQGHWDEWLALAEKAEARSVDAADYDSAGWRACDAGMVYFRRKQADAVLDCAARASKHWSEAGARERAEAIRLLGFGHHLKCDYVAAIAAYSESLDFHRSCAAENADIASILNDLADAQSDAGNFIAAESYYSQALSMSRAIGHAEGIANFVGKLAGLALVREDWLTAEALAREALPLSKAVHRQELVARDNRRLANALLRQGKAAEALSYARRAVEIYIHLGSPDVTYAQIILTECEAMVRDR